MAQAEFLDRIKEGNHILIKKVITSPSAPKTKAIECVVVRRTFGGKSGTGQIVVNVKGSPEGEQFKFDGNEGFSLNTVATWIILQNPTLQLWGDATVIPRKPLDEVVTTEVASNGRNRRTRKGDAEASSIDGA